MAHSDCITLLDRDEYDMQISGQPNARTKNQIENSLY